MREHVLSKTTTVLCLSRGTYLGIFTAPTGLQGFAPFLAGTVKRYDALHAGLEDKAKRRGKVRARPSWRLPKRAVRICRLE